MPQSSAFHFIENALRNPQMIDAATALYENRLHDAEPLLKARLREMPFDVAAMRMLAELAGRIGRYQDAENLLRRALELSPEFLAARSNLAMVLHRQGRSAEALSQLSKLEMLDSKNLANANLKAAALGRVGEYDEALELYELVLKSYDNQPKIWMSYGHVLKTIGRQTDCVTAYYKALQLAPWLGEAWWSLANLKTVKFTGEDIKAMMCAFDLEYITDEDRFHLHFALGKAYDDVKQPQTAFDHYVKGNALRKDTIDYDPGIIVKHVKQATATYTKSFFSNSAMQGCSARDPIFIVGMPRAGSTLIEQILSSHSLIEGTMELPNIPRLLINASASEHDRVLLPDELRKYGEAFMEETRIHRKTNKPFFIDKLPNNWLHVGFIKAILPNARIIDARRHPLDCCLSNFKQHFAKGQSFSYSLSDVGQYYTNYVCMMTHYDAVLPGQIHLVLHENLINNTEQEVRAVLAFLELPFEDACMRFYENDRAVRTASSEQVRRPINHDGVGQWQNVEDLLGPLKLVLGSALNDYPIQQSHM